MQVFGQDTKRRHFYTVLSIQSVREEFIVWVKKTDAGVRV